MNLSDYSHLPFNLHVKTIYLYLCSMCNGIYQASVGDVETGHQSVDYYPLYLSCSNVSKLWQGVLFSFSLDVNGILSEMIIVKVVKDIQKCRSINICGYCNQKVDDLLVI